MFWTLVPFLFLTLCNLLGTCSADPDPCTNCTADPCTNYTAINDTKMSVAYMASGMDNLTCQTLPVLKWYRYTLTSDGRMANTCPAKLQCGSKNQIWFNDTIPTETDGEIMKRICIHEGPWCCTKSNMINTKNCTDFIVYQYIPTQPNCTNYCYDAPDNSFTTDEGGESRLENTTQSFTTFGDASSSEKNASYTINGKYSENSTLSFSTKEGKSSSEKDVSSLCVWIMIAIIAVL